MKWQYKSSSDKDTYSLHLKLIFAVIFSVFIGYFRLNYQVHCRLVNYKCNKVLSNQNLYLFEVLCVIFYIRSDSSSISELSKNSNKFRCFKGSLDHKGLLDLDEEAGMLLAWTWDFKIKLKSFVTLFITYNCGID